MKDFNYLDERFDPQLKYFEAKSAFNQRRYLLMRRLMLIASWLTPVAIFVQFLVVKDWRDYWAIVPMILSTIAVGSYQWEEVHNYGSQWSKFRLVAENLKHQRAYFEFKTGPYNNLSPEQSQKMFVEIVEKLLEGTDINYFTLMVDPHRSPTDNK
ncbi:MAG TPA: DUF4231 domain-containing protein [Pirellulales bacterium]|nr:DUF4231 domain-containing protein [Pirellulales bacterium]